MRIKRKLKSNYLVSQGIIKENDYDIIRNGLISNNEKTIKTSIQRLISEYEEGRNLIKFFQKDLCAILYDLVQHTDSNIRKWTYHLTAYVHDKNLINRCVLNLTKNKENDIENITWIIALASCLYDENELLLLYNNNAKVYGITDLQFKLCANVFSKSVNVIKITRRDVRKIVDSDDFFSKMWLTKMYSCYYDINKRNEYSKFINDDIMNAMIDDNNMQRYALWAFSTKKNVNVNKIKINPYKALDLGIKSQAWYFNCLFKDKQYVLNNMDYINFLMNSFSDFHSVVQFGILRGLEMADYNLGCLSNQLIFIYNELDEDIFEESLVLIQLLKILIKHASENNDIEDFLTVIKRKTNNIEIKRCLFTFRAMKERDSMSRNYYIGSVGQINEKVNVAIQNSNITSEKAEKMTQLTGILADISERVKDGACDDLLLKDVELNNMITKVKYELSKLNNDKNNLEEVYLKKIEELEMALDALKKSNIKERKSVFSSVLTKLSQVCSITVAVPKIVDMIEPMINHFKTFLGL